MKKTVCLLSVLCIAASCFAQGWWRGGRKAVQAVRAPLNAVVGRRAASALPRVPNFSVPAAAVERYVFKSVSPTPARQLVFTCDEMPYRWILDSAAEYAQVAEHFKVFKKEADVFLYYQSSASESRTLHPEEISHWRQKIDDMAAELSAIRLRVDADDPFLSFADEYLTYTRWVVYPHAKDIYFITPLPPRADRPFILQEFFLQNPVEVSTRWQLATVRAKRVSAMLPPGLRVAVVNDFRFFRQRVDELHRQGRLFPDGTLQTYEGADDLLEDVLKNGKKYDVIFTDIIISGGGGGYYLAAELRRNGYNGVIIALSSYPESEELGRKMFERGMDGMIRLEGGAAYKRGWPADIMQKLLNYYHYRAAGGWSR
uniref:Response regulatory domain-containing protein n=1 Tax=uncultured Elusimicrobia bacterium TaxID=699876 RepID=A0A650ELZ0_9BACT|nr:hypothetical protein Elusimicrob2101_1000 [uncultured Elusimicrobia bacterium]